MQKDKLNWLLDFIQTDLDALSGGDRAKIFYELQEFLPQDIQKDLRSAIDGLGAAKGIQSVLRDYFNYFIDCIKQKIPPDTISFQASRIVRFEGDKIYNDNLISHFDTYLKIILLDTFQEMSLKAIRQCKECGRYFVHLSKRERDYCCNKCASRAGARKRRREDPEGYKAKMRGYMKRKYREKREGG